MTCPHIIPMHAPVRFDQMGHCDTCGGEIDTRGHWGYYIGDDRMGHVFSVSPRIHCTGCNNWLSKLRVVCGEDWRVPELEEKKPVLVEVKR